MLPSMTTPAELIRAARQRAGLSMRALAADAGVAYTTVSRIEHGEMDPTFGMIGRLLAAATGERLALAPDGGSHLPELAGLADAWHTDATGQDRPDWTRLRTFLDHLALHPEQRSFAIRRMPPPSGSAFQDNLLAAIAEKTADDGDRTRPAWTAKIPALDHWWATVGTPRMRATAEATTPPQLSARHISMTGDSLWRTRTRVT
jgi:transcriptional regulator with XRE-family HTH domain